MHSVYLDGSVAALLGAAVGASEIISRYKDAPVAALRSWPASLYIALNAGASAGALALIRANGWLADFGTWAQILLAGVSAMAFFRSSLFLVRAGDRDVPVGPSGFLQIFLTATDRAVDRKRAASRSDGVATVMKGLDFEKAVKALPPYCLALMQNVAPEDQEVLNRVIEALSRQALEPSVKTLLLGIELMNVVGIDVLTTAIRSLGDEIRPASKPSANRTVAGP